MTKKLYHQDCGRIQVLHTPAAAFTAAPAGQWFMKRQNRSAYLMISSMERSGPDVGSRFKTHFWLLLEL